VSTGSRGRVGLLTSFLFAGACAGQAPEPLATVRNEPVVRVTGRGSDQAGAFCSDFRLSDQQAQQFFVRSAIITEKQLHDDYEYLPCWVEGTITTGADTATWKIRAGATAEIQRADGTTERRGCQECDDLFQ